MGEYNLEALTYSEPNCYCRIVPLAYILNLKKIGYRLRFLMNSLDSVIN